MNLKKTKSFPYIPNTHDDLDEMLKEIGAKSINELFDDIPNNLKLKKDLDIGESLSELEVLNYMKHLSNKNNNINNLTCFLGAGAYDHYIPSVIDHVISRSEFYTSYTPYQPEISQAVFVK